MGAWPCFRVVLDTEDGSVAMRESRHGAVIQIQMGNRDAAAVQGRRIKGKSMVLAGDLHLAMRAAGMIESSMAVGELEGAAAEGQTEDLMAQTNAKKG